MPKKSLYTANQTSEKFSKKKKFLTEECNINPCYHDGQLLVSQFSPWSIGSQCFQELPLHESASLHSAAPSLYVAPYFPVRCQLLYSRKIHLYTSDICIYVHHLCVWGQERGVRLSICHCKLLSWLQADLINIEFSCHVSVTTTMPHPHTPPPQECQ